MMTMADFRGHLLAIPDYSNETFLTAFLARLATADPAAEGVAAAERRAAFGFPGETTTDKPFAFRDGVAVIPVHGMLLNKFPYSWGWVTGYSFIRNMLRAASSDPDVTDIILDVNSGGGMVTGCQETAEYIQSLRDVKPITAVVDGWGASAAYWVASGATTLVMTKSSEVGSIGCVMVLISYARAMDAAGIDVNIIHEGERKVDGSSLIPLSNAARTELTAKVKKSYDAFVAGVVSARGVKDQAVRDTEARMYAADDAIRIGLADRIISSDWTIRDALALDSDPNEETSMTDAELAARRQQEIDAAVQAAIPTAVAASLTAERTRVAAIVALPEAATRPRLATALATNSEMTPEQAAIVLRAAAEETATTDVDLLSSAMQRSGGGAGIGAGTGAGGGAGEGESFKPGERAAAMVAAFKAYKGNDPLAVN